jgi:small-conductance mechanosensitive channel
MIMGKIIIYSVGIFMLIASCSSNDDSKINELESKLEKQQEEINQQKEQQLRDQIEQKEKEIEELKKEKKASDQISNYYARGEGFYPEGSERRLTFEDLVDLTSRDLKIMRNEIFARHGYIFKTPDMINHFSNQSWYRPMYSDVTSMLSNIEKTNVNFIKTYE